MGNVDTAHAERLLDDLEAGGVVTVDEETGAVATTPAFEQTRSPYEDTYLDVTDEEFRQTVAEVFGLDEDEADRRVDELGVTRHQVIALLSLRSFLDDPPGIGDLSVMAQMVADLTPTSPVPAAVMDVTDDHEGFLADHADAVVTVWAQNCEPCKRMKENVDELLAAVPDGVAVAGVDGEQTPKLRRAYEVTAAPWTLVFADGELVESLRGFTPVEELAAVFEDVFE
ncbi:thioredoxin family protein [Halobacteriaceae archaeon GCM10025711]